MSKIDDIINRKKNGLFYNNRLILPFKANILKIIVDTDIYTDFSSGSKDIQIIENDNFTDIYFKQYKSLVEVVSKFEAIKMVLVDKDDDIFDFSKHKKIAVYLGEKHKTTIEFTEDDILFIE